ncbi:MAG: mandelate racemase/muconate lactonizing enzyme family protein [Bryobacteraceae bacterium]
MKITSMEAIPVRLPRDLASATGTAGSPTTLRRSASPYRWSEAYPCLYSVNFETALVKLTTDSGLTGWGEAQAPLAPEVACSIVDHLLRPVVLDADFDGTVEGVRGFWQRMYSTMRVRGQTGGFMLDAISAVDMALWDLAGKMAGKPVCRLLAPDGAKTRIPAYISGLPNSSGEKRREAAKTWLGRGYTAFKLFFDSGPETLLPALDDVLSTLGGEGRVAVDALWRFTPTDMIGWGRELDARNALWLEAPLPPEDPAAHAALARAIRTPVAIGESYRTTFELAPFFRERAMAIVQPDLGRCGITEGLRIAAEAAGHGIDVVPHISVAFGPQVAAALHFAAAVPECRLTEYNPLVLDVANRFLQDPLELKDASYLVPQGPGLGVEIVEAELARAAAR